MMAYGIRTERKGLRRYATAARLRWFLATAGLAILSACASAPTPAPANIAYDPKNGDGIGGTGIRSEHVAEIRHGDGIGGTGIVGTISGFGSIIVNGLELQFDRSTAVATDGRPAALEALRVGQVVQGLARQKDGRMTLETLDIQHAVSGPIGSIDHAAQTLTVLGQNIRLNLGGDKVAMKAFATLRAGDMVSVSGLRLSDGTIIASRVDQHEDDGRLVVRGEAASVSSDRVRIGGLDVPMSPDVAVSKPTQGGRVFVSGRMINGSFVPDVVTGGTGLPFEGKADAVSLEGYAPERGAPLSLSGAAVNGALPAGVGPNDHIVVTGQIAGADQVTAAAVAKVRTVVTIMKAQGSQRPAAIRPNTDRPDLGAPIRPERPESRPDIPARTIERPTGVGV